MNKSPSASCGRHTCWATDSDVFFSFEQLVTMLVGAHFLYNHILRPYDFRLSLPKLFPLMLVFAWKSMCRFSILWRSTTLSWRISSRKVACVNTFRIFRCMWSPILGCVQMLFSCCELVRCVCYCAVRETLGSNWVLSQGTCTLSTTPGLFVTVQDRIGVQAHVDFSLNARTYRTYWYIVPQFDFRGPLARLKGHVWSGRLPGHPHTRTLALPSKMPVPAARRHCKNKLGLQGCVNLY